MRALVVYESMYGNTHLVADVVAATLRDEAGADAVAVPVSAADASALHDVDLIVVGGPTHVHGMTRPSTRKAAVEAAAKPDSGLDVERDAGEGLREWFDGVGPLPKAAAAFDTRIKGPAALTGRASKGISKRFREHGCEVILEPESFVVSKENHLLPDELAHARGWARRLAKAVS